MSKEKKETVLDPKDLGLVEENKEDFKQSIISRKNLTNEFTIESIEKHLATLAKMKKEAKSTLNLAHAMVENVERNNKSIKTMPSKKKHAIWMWYENNAIVKEVTPQLKAIEEEIVKHNDYLDVIYKKFGFEDKIVLDLKELENGKRR